MRLIPSGFSYRRPLFYGICFMLGGFWSVMSFAMPKSLLIDANCSRFEVKLPANPSTGFRWTLESYDAEHFSCLETEYVAATTARMGAPGTRVFYFKQKEGAVCPESTTLRFLYGRSWETDSSSSTEVTVKFK
jgi:inhibitor of cysteine peptidase